MDGKHPLRRSPEVAGRGKCRGSGFGSGGWQRHRGLVKTGSDLRVKASVAFHSPDRTKITPFQSVGSPGARLT